MIKVTFRAPCSGATFIVIGEEAEARMAKHGWVRQEKPTNESAFGG